MKYWHVYYDKSAKQYKIALFDKSYLNHEDMPEMLVVFNVFDMAYQYISTLNGNVMSNVYSRWTVSR